jgi:hypothetical protein
MRFESAKGLKGKVFWRLTGKRSTFEKMAAVLFAAKGKQKAAGASPTRSAPKTSS